MNYCPQANKIISYCLQQLTDQEREEFQAHLASCNICQRELAIEMAIENELGQEFDPGLIENRVKVRLQLQQTRDPVSFWLYTFRMAVFGITAAIASFVLIPFLSKPLHVIFGALSRYTDGLAGLLNRSTPINNLFLIIGFCYILLIVSSIFSLAQIRR